MLAHDQLKTCQRAERDLFHQLMNTRSLLMLRAYLALQLGDAGRGSRGR